MTTYNHDEIKEFIEKIEERWREEDGKLDDFTIWFDLNKESITEEIKLERHTFTVDTVRAIMIDTLFKVPMEEK